MLFSKRSPLILILALAIVWISACQTAVKPEPVISDENMSLIMADLAIAEAATHMLTGPVKDSLYRAYAKQIFEIRKTTIEEYESSLRILVTDEERMLNIAQQAEKRIFDQQKAMKPDSSAQKNATPQPQ